jgi:hypothetical protein
MRYLVLFPLYLAAICQVPAPPIQDQPATVNRSTPAPEAPEPAYNDVFLSRDPTTGAMSPLERRTANTRVSIIALGYGGYKMVYQVSGGKSPVRFTVSAFLEFVVRSPVVRGGNSDPDSVYVLQQWSAKKKQRELAILQGSPFVGATVYNLEGGPGIPVTFEKFGEQSLRVKSTMSLSPGEYTLSRRGLHMAAIDFFCFGID